MSDKKLVSFRLWGDYALYKKPWCNREQQSFLIPTKTAITGMVGAILGYSKNSYLENLPPEDLELGIKINRKIGKELQGYNFIQSENLKNQTEKFSNPYRKSSIDRPNSRTRLEVLKDPDYRIFLHINNPEIHEKLTKSLKENRYVFPPFLGQANLFGNIGKVKESELEEKNVSSVETVVPSKIIDGSSVEGTIYNERIPVSMNKDRSEPKYMSIAVKNKGDSKIDIKNRGIFSAGVTTNERRVVLF